jgi:2-polyprenyl-6-methoxyphenol hydroxylase-like FAD-dependent oxidoreductase
MRVLISGASIAGPVLAYWLARRGFAVTVVERAPALRKTGGHAVDLFRPAMDISEQMGVLDRIEALKTGTNRLIVRREGGRRPVDVDYQKLVAAMSDRHVEIMRDDLSQIYFDASRDARTMGALGGTVEYIFDDEITAISGDGDVTFGKAAPRSFDVIVGADGLHSGVRRLTFGPDAGHTNFLGAHLAVLSVPKTVAREGEMTVHLGAGRMASTYTADHLDDARVLFLFRSEPLTCHHRDLARQKAVVRETFAGMHPDVDRWLGELGHSELGYSEPDGGEPAGDKSDLSGAFYFDAITQLELTSWSSGRVTLVGDAGYCPGPAVGGSTSLAVFGAYVLAGELARAEGDYLAAFNAYERVMMDPVLRSRRFARTVAKGLVPSSTVGVRTFMGAAKAVTTLPTSLVQPVARLNRTGVRLYDSMSAPSYPLP